MGNVLVLAEQAHGQLRPAALPALTFGKQVAQTEGGKLIALVIGSSVAEAAAAAAQLGAAEVIVVDDAKLDPYLAESYAPIVAQIAKAEGVTVVAATATALGKDLLPRVAALLDAALVSDVIAVAGPKKYRRPMLAGNVILTVESTAPTTVVTVRQTAFEPAQPAGASAPVKKVDAGPIDAHGAAFVSLTAAKSDRPDLTEAKVVVSGGRGMRDAKNFELVAQLADLLGGAMGASRAACDAGMVPNDLQVGQTGKVVAPQLYVAIAISGAIQHLAGMKGSKVIVAINKDGDPTTAPILQVADYSLVAQWETALPALIEAIKKVKAQGR